jgi:hypothetical protein
MVLGSVLHLSFVSKKKKERGILKRIFTFEHLVLIVLGIVNFLGHVIFAIVGW